jgi:hypothetical protein
MNLPIVFADEVITGIRLLNNAINEEVTRKLIVNAVKQLLVTGPRKKKYN